jgi:hypothetical protein
MSVLWHKVWADLWRNKTRTLLAVLSIASGVFAIGMMFGMSDLLTTNLDESHHQSSSRRGRRGGRTLQRGQRPLPTECRQPVASGAGVDAGRLRRPEV